MAEKPQTMKTWSKVQTIIATITGVLVLFGMLGGVALYAFGTRFETLVHAQVVEAKADAASVKADAVASRAEISVTKAENAATVAEIKAQEATRAAQAQQVQTQLLTTKLDTTQAVQAEKLGQIADALQKLTFTPIRPNAAPTK